MHWTEVYRSKIKTADEALTAVKSRDRVYIHQGSNEPEELVRALIARGLELHDVEIVHMMTTGNADYAKPEFEGHFRHNAFFIGGNVREAVSQIGESADQFTEGARVIAESSQSLASGQSLGAPWPQ